MDIQVFQAILSLVILGLAIAVFVRLETKRSSENNEPKRETAAQRLDRRAAAKGKAGPKASTRKAEQKKEAPKKE